MTMTLPARQSDNDLLYLHGPVSREPPYFLQPCILATADAESLKGSNIIASFNSAIDRSSTTSLGLGVTECQPNESVGSSPASLCSYSLDAIRTNTVPVLYTEIVERDRGSLETLALINTNIAGTLENFEESTNASPGNLSRSGRFELLYKKDGNTPPFRKWMRSFRRKGPKGRAIVYHLSSMEDASALKDEDAMSNMPSSKAWTKTPSSSMRFVTAVKTASNTFASLSIAGGSARRKSSGGTLDDATMMRMRDRRCALEELINTEEYYIADLKVLVNVSCSCFLFSSISIDRGCLVC